MLQAYSELYICGSGSELYVCGSELYVCGWHKALAALYVYAL